MWTKIIAWIVSLFKQEKAYFTGLLPDLRTQDQKDKDWLHEELVKTPPPVNWVTKDPSTWRKEPIRNQDGSSSCVMQSGAKVLGIEYSFRNPGVDFLVLSALDGYSLRANKPAEGMNFDDAMKILTRNGLCLESQLPSQGLSESQMNTPVTRTDAMIAIENSTKSNAYVKFATIDIDQIASVIATGKAVELGFTFSYPEWLDVPVVQTNNPTLAHGVAGVDFTLWNGEKAIIIDDSWGIFPRFYGQRVITESFLKARCIYAGYLIDPIYNSPTQQSVKPKILFSSTINFGDSGDNVNNLQVALQYLGFFPSNVTPTGFYGGITAAAVLKFQLANNVDTSASLNLLAGKIVGPKTLSVLNQIFN